MQAMGAVSGCVQQVAPWKQGNVRHSLTKRQMRHSFAKCLSKVPSGEATNRLSGTCSNYPSLVGAW